MSFFIVAKNGIIKLILYMNYRKERENALGK